MDKNSHFILVHPLSSLYVMVREKQSFNSSEMLLILLYRFPSFPFLETQFLKNLIKRVKVKL